LYSDEIEYPPKPIKIIIKKSVDESRTECKNKCMTITYNTAPPIQTLYDFRVPQKILCNIIFKIKSLYDIQLQNTNLASNLETYKTASGKTASGIKESIQKIYETKYTFNLKYKYKSVLYTISNISVSSPQHQERAAVYNNRLTISEININEDGNIFNYKNIIYNDTLHTITYTNAINNLVELHVSDSTYYSLSDLTDLSEQ